MFSGDIFFDMVYISSISGSAHVLGRLLGPYTFYGAAGEIEEKSE